MLTSIELCAGAGGQALGLEKAGFKHVALIDEDYHSCKTLQFNRPKWNVIEGDLREFYAHDYKGIDLVAGGVPCPPFSVGGKQLGAQDERNLFDEAIRVVSECRPRAVMLENVKGLLESKFEEYRSTIDKEFLRMGYRTKWKLLNACDFGVPQLRPRVVLVALREQIAENFEWPVPRVELAPTVGETLIDLMKTNGWEGADEWKVKANRIAPTLVGGSKKHGGPDLGPSRAKKAWADIGINGHLVQYDSPEKGFIGKEGFEGMPYLSLRMAARIQGFPDSWEFSGKKTHAYRQIGNAFPPPVAQAVGESIRNCLLANCNRETRAEISKDSSSLVCA